MKADKPPAGLTAESELALNTREAMALAIQWHRSGRLAEAEGIYRQVLERVPHQPDALHYLGLLSHQLGRGPEAVELIRRAVAAAPDYADAHNNLGNVLKEQGRLEEAAAAFRRVNELAPNYVAAQNNLGVILKAQGKLQEAIGAYEKALLIDPDYIEAHLNLGNARASRDEVALAIAAYERVIALKPDHTEAHYALGHICKREGKLEEAAAAFRKTVALRPNHTDAFFDLANVLNRQGAFAEAIEAYRRAIVNNPGCAKAYEDLGNLLNLTGETAQAVEVWRQWLKIEPENPIPLHMLAAGAGTQAPARAADEYVKKTFDWFADTFDERLQQLDYRAPTLVSEALCAHLPGERANGLDILDAGCGTGLCGPLLRPYAARLAGIDLSPAMLEKARARHLYDELIEGELTALLRGFREAYDVIVFADTLVYFGELKPVLDLCFQGLRPGGIIIFTLERAEESAAPTGFLLHPLGRYCHTEAFVRANLSTAGLNLRTVTWPTLRREAGNPVLGLLAVAQK